MNKIFIIDGNSLINRAYYALPPLATKSGEVYNAVFGFVNIVIKLITENNPTHLVVAFDAGKKTFRNDLFEGYKATRKKMPDELASQLAPLKDLLHKMNIKTIEKLGIEADDIIGTLVKNLNYPSVVVTGDRDCLQLIDSNCEVWLTKHGISSIISYNERQLKEDMGLSPLQIIDLKSLMGDSSDNIPGVAGIGEKTAKDLLAKYQTLQGVYDNIDNVTGKTKEKLLADKDMAFLSYRLATIDTQAKFDFSLDEMKVVMPFSQEVFATFKKYEFNSLLKRQDLFGEVKEKAEQVLVQTEDIEDIEKLHELCKEKAVAFLEDESGVFVAFEKDKQFLYHGKLEDLKPLFLDESIKKVFHKSKPLFHKLDGQIDDNFYDVSIAVYLINSSAKTDDLGSILNFLNINQTESASSLLCAFKTSWKKLLELNLGNLYFMLELPLVRVLYQMEKDGVCVDEKVLNELSEKFTQEIFEIKKQIFYLADEDFNLNSPKQLAHILFDKLKLEVKGNKKQSTSVTVLEAIRGKHPIVELLLHYRTISKLQSTYIDGLRPFIKNGKIHTTFNQTLTVTGRLSSVEPNLQNIPIRTKEGRVLRKIFTASEGCVLISADYSQIELRLLAHYSGDFNLLEAYRQNRDIHAVTASQIFNTPLEKVTSEQRRMAKAVNFGIIYGISPYGLSVGTGISVAEAKRYIDKYFEMYPTIKSFLNKSVEEVKEKGFVSSLFGRRRNIAEVYSTNHNVAMFGERAAMNMPLQGTASDIIKLAMLQMSQHIAGLKLKSKLILQIHDELIFDVPENEKEQMMKIIKSTMENVVKLDVPLVAEVSVGKNWFECDEKK